MATGRVDVLRRRDSPKYSKREPEYYRNGHYGVKLSHGRDDGVRNRDHVWSSRRCGGQSKPFERVVESVPEKKRKFSPVIWDKEEKKGKVSSNNAAVQVSVIPRSPTLNRCCSTEVPEGQLVPEKERESPASTGREEKEVRVSSKNRVVSINQFVSDEVVSNSPTSEIHEVEVSEAKPSEADGLKEIPQLEPPADLHAPLQLEAQKNLVDKDQARISLSRWASDSDSPMSDSCRSTPESGEIRREESVRSRTSISGEGHSVGGDKCSREEIDGVSENGGFDHMYPDSEEEDGQMYPDSEEDDDQPRGRSTNMLQACRSIDEYAKLEGLGEGTYGVVYRAKDKQTGETVAIKKVKMDKMDEGFPITSLREINILLSCNHPSIVGVKEVVVNKADDIFMVMEYMEYDLRTLLDSMKQPFGIGEVKYLMKSLLEGVKYLHDNWILHRDLKTSNLLLNKEGELKICDFGMSRQYGDPLKPYTALVVTLWYRAPEILLGKKQYSTAIDMWSVGCIMAEFLAKEALFQGKNELDQLDKVFKILGTPIETDWPGVSKLPNFKHIKVKQSENLLPKKFSGSCFTGSPMLSSSGLDLLMKLLTYDPDKRIKVDDALSHDWFKDFPAPRAFKPSANVHERFMNLRQRQERDRHQRRR